MNKFFRPTMENLEARITPARFAVQQFVTFDNLRKVVIGSMPQDFGMSFQMEVAESNGDFSLKCKNSNGQPEKIDQYFAVEVASGKWKEITTDAEKAKYLSTKVRQLEIYGTDNDDLIDCSRIKPTKIFDAKTQVRIIGYEGDNNIIGTSLDDDISAGWGNDIIHGGPGNDTVGTFGGYDILYGDEGNDRIFVELHEQTRPSKFKEKPISKFTYTYTYDTGPYQRTFTNLRSTVAIGGDGDDDLSVGPQISSEKDSVLMYGGRGKDTFGFRNNWSMAGSEQLFNKNKTVQVLDWNQGAKGSPAKPPNNITKDGPNTRIVFGVTYEWVHYCFWYSTLDGALKFQNDQSFRKP